MTRPGAAVALAVLVAACMTPAPPAAPPGIAALLAPTGKLRAAINYASIRDHSLCASPAKVRFPH